MVRTNSIDLKGQKAIIKSSIADLTTYEPDYAYLLKDLNRFDNAQWLYLIGEFRLAVLSGTVTVSKAEGKALVKEQCELLSVITRIVAEATAVF